MTSIDRNYCRSQLFTDLAIALGMKQLRAGREISRDEAGHRLAGRWIEAVWAVAIESSHSQWLGIATIHRNDGSAQAVVISKSTESAAHNIGPVVLTVAEDVVFDALNTIQIFEKHRGISLDGISYSWITLTSSLSATIDFSNPRTSGLTRLEAHLVEFVQLIIKTTGVIQSDAIVSNWIEEIELRVINKGN